MQPGGSLLWSCNWGWLVIASSPAEAYHPGTAVADHHDIEEAVTRVLDAIGAAALPIRETAGLEGGTLGISCWKNGLHSR